VFTAALFAFKVCLI